MNRISNFVGAMLGLIVSLVSQSAQAGFVGMPRGLSAIMDRIRFEEPTLPPFAFTDFCLHYPDECRLRRRMIFRGSRVRMDDGRWTELKTVNSRVNSAIRAERNEGGVATEKWLINPERGDCNDYAVSKRHELVKRGWSARNLLLSEVVTSWGEHHLVLVVRTRNGDLVLDNLAQRIRTWTQTPYRWVRIQRPDDGRSWSTIATRDGAGAARVG